jgi:hypothetical protein
VNDMYENRLLDQDCGAAEGINDARGALLQDLQCRGSRCVCVVGLLGGGGRSSMFWSVLEDNLSVSEIWIQMSDVDVG